MSSRKGPCIKVNSNVYIIADKHFGAMVDWKFSIFARQWIVTVLITCVEVERQNRNRQESRFTDFYLTLP